MRIEQQLVSLELAKKLKELGVEKKSLFYWWENKTKGATLHYGEVAGIVKSVFISAFTVAELGELLQEVTVKIDCGDVCYDNFFENTKPTIGWGGNYHEESADTEADARAKMLIYLLENKLITL